MKIYMTRLFIFILSICVFNSNVMSEERENTEDLPNVLDGQELVNELRNGGYILYFRHGITDHSTHDADRQNLDNCSTQRLLSDEGRQQMKDIGDAIQQLNIKIGTIESSPYCRSIDTATQAFGRMEINQNLKHTVTADEETSNRQAKQLRKRLSIKPEISGSNDVLSSHTANLQEAVGIWPTPEGVAIIFKPEGNDNFEYIATVPPLKWMKFAEEYSQ
jgi:phosphohistidine phosphatase SixA